MIAFILDELRRQGVVITDEAGTAAMVAAHAMYGGERLYVPKLPKLQNAARIGSASKAGARTTSEIVQKTGLSVRYVKMLRRR